MNTIKRKISHKKRIKSKKVNTNFRTKTKKDNKLLLSLIILILFFVAIRIIGNFGDSSEILQNDAEKILNLITSNNLKILDSNQVDEKSIEKIMEEDYEKLKDNLGLESDFCIHFEDNDGNVIKINGREIGIGSSKVKINGISCG